MRTCSIRGCSNRHLARGWCGKHYQRWRIFGDANHYIPKTVNERFMVRIQVTPKCWLWTGAIAGRYGQFTRDGIKTPAHRIAYEIQHGRIPNGAFICHKCDNPICVRPSRLFLGDSFANMQDMVRKGRHPKQLASYRAKLSVSDVRAIRKANGTVKSLAQRYGVSEHTITAAKNRETWRHIT